MPGDTDFKTELSRLESGRHRPVTSATEAQWYDVWMAERVSGHDPLAIALVGGALADRLAWVFHAGYQGMMRYAFPFCAKDGWAGYLVAEDKTGEYPGTAVTTSEESEGRMTLSGFKSWVAASEHVDHLVVQVGRPEGNIMVLVDRDEPGMTLSSRAKPGFLADLSQGFAAFENVFIADDRAFGSEDLPANFAHSEAHHVLTALNAFMVSHALRVGGDAGISTQAVNSLKLAQDLIDRNAVDDDFFLGIADLDAATTETAGLFEAFVETRDRELFQRWHKDRSLVNMFSRGLRKKARWLREK